MKDRTQEFLERIANATERIAAATEFLAEQKRAYVVRCGEALPPAVEPEPGEATPGKAKELTASESE